MSESGKKAKPRKKSNNFEPQIPEYTGVVAEKPIYEARLPGKEFYLPNMCCVCLGPVEEHKTIGGNANLAQSKKLYIDIPYCEQCYSRLRRRLVGRISIDQPKNHGVRFCRAWPEVTLLFRNKTYYEMFKKMNYPYANYP